MSAAELEAGGVLLAGWLILACYLGLFLTLWAEPIERALCRGWRIITIAVALRRDAALGYGWRRAMRVARRLA